MKTWAGGIIGMAVLGQLALAERTAAQPCAGDCDGNGSVGITELITGVNISLGLSGECDALDTDVSGTVQIFELVAAVANALDGCTAEPATPAAVVANYAALLYATYSDALEGAEALRDAVDAFVAAPSPATLEAAQEAWLAGRPAYLQTEMARFYDGPIDNAEDGPEGLINAWPLDESYIDYVEGAADGGIVNAVTLYPTIDAELLVELNEAEGEDTISTGWHAIEFLLWGQDLSASGPGTRPYTDYITDGTGTAANQARRGDYLRAAAALMVDDIARVRAAWAPGVAGNYRAEFLAVAPAEALRRILTGMGTLSGGELTGERLSVAFDTKDQEDEHSCFSDNTHVDHLLDQTGIQNAFLGRYGPVSGPGIDDLCGTVNPTLADQARAAFTAAHTAVDDIPEPFDQAILGDDSTAGRQAIAAAIAALEAQTTAISDCAAALGIDISTTLP